jgi:parvulin-like peptidyl-prolyl isomerase
MVIKSEEILKMPAHLQVDNRIISEAEIIPLLTSYQMLPQLLRENIIDQAIASITCTSEETANACEQFYTQNQLTSETARQTWLDRHNMSVEQLEALATRSLRIEKFKQATWGHKLESYFLQRKGHLDKVIYSLLRVKELGVAQELYYRIQEGEQTFADLAREYSQGPEAQTGGLTGPVELSLPPRPLAQMLAVSQPRQLWPPLRLGEWIVVVRLEQLIPAKLDEPTRDRLLNELFEAWLHKQIANSQFHIQS